MDRKLKISIDVVEPYPTSIDDHYSFETSYTDMDLGDILNKLNAMFIAMTYHPDTVGRSFLETGLEKCNAVTVKEVLEDYGYFLDIEDDENKRSPIEGGG